MRFEVVTQRHGKLKIFPCRTVRAVTNLVTDMLNRDDRILIRPCKSSLPEVINVVAEVIEEKRAA